LWIGYLLHIWAYINTEDLIQCTLDDSADNTKVYGWKIYMHLPCKLGGRVKHEAKEYVILYLTPVLINMLLRHEI